MPDVAFPDLDPWSSFTDCPRSRPPHVGRDPLPHGFPGAPPFPTDHLSIQLMDTHVGGRRWRDLVVQTAVSGLRLVTQ